MKSLPFLALVLAAIVWPTAPALAAKAPSPALEGLDALYPELDALYRELHQNPELSHQEEKTAAKLAERLRALGFEVTPKVGGHGVVAVLRNGKGPTVLLRTDMDALPVEEKTGLPYASKATARDETGQGVSVMHACGHDVHMTAWLGTATLLARAKERWRGTLVMVGQPAEERGSGARGMLADGLYKRFSKPDFAVALHNSATAVAGSVEYVAGDARANVDSVDITLYGKGGHGAYPHTTVDPIVLAAR
ncbi:MAG TPA: amidohydrolase, partial [Archangium sp.]|nr:amidohydrolase [Archangium sp.]